MRPGGPRKVIGPSSHSRTRRSPRGRCDSPQFAGQHLHQKAVVPGAVRAALVLAHHADRAEPDALVAADRDRVVDGRIDRDPVVAALLEQPPRDGAHRLGPEPATVALRVQRDVDAGVAVHRVGLLPRLDHPNRPLALAHHPDRRVGVLEALADVVLGPLAPPARDLGRAEDRDDRRHVGLARGPQHDAFAAQDGHGPSQSAAGSPAPAAARPATSTPTAGSVQTPTPVASAIVPRFERCITVGSSGHGVSTTARTSSPAARAASTVSSVWLMVPSPGRAATTTGRPSAPARSGPVKSTASGPSTPPPPSTTSASAPAAAARAAATTPAGSIAVPASSAARCGETAGPKRSGATASGATPAAAPSSSWSAGRPGSGSSSPVTTGLNAPTRTPSARSAAAMAAASTVLPTPVSVPVTKQPRTPATAAAAAGRPTPRAGCRSRRRTAARRPRARRPRARPRRGGSRRAAPRGRARARPPAAPRASATP